MNNDHWLTRPATIKLLWIVFIFVLALTVVAGIWMTEEPHFEIEGLFAFNAVYGFLVCAAMILAAKVLGLLLKRRDTYYEERASND
ncbi:MAG: hypothetical protein ABI409_03325 [Ramlibacter sp.]